MTPSKPESPDPAPASQPPKRGGKGRSSNGLMALGAAAVLTVYSAGYARTDEAAKRIAETETGRRPPGRAQGTEGTEPGAATASEGQASTGQAATPAANGAATGVSAASGSAEGAAAAMSAPSTGTATASAAAKPAGAAQAPTSGGTGAPASGGATPATAAEAVAPAAVDSTALRPDFPPWKDGTYYGWGRSRHGDIEARLEIREGKITSAVIADCRTRYSCSIIDRLIPQVVERQSPDVDTVSGATQSADAWYYAVYDALSKSKP